MKEQQARSLLMDYIYDEISAADKEKLVNELKNDPDLRKELDELRQTQGLLQQMPEVESPEKKLHIMEASERSLGQWFNDAKLLLPRSGWVKAALATAACLALLLIVGSAASLQVNSNKAGFSVSFGYDDEVVQQPINEEKIKRLIAQANEEDVERTVPASTLTEQDAEQFFTEEEAEALLAKMQQQNEALLTAFAQEMNKQDQQQLKKIVKFFQAQRIYDLKRIKQSLNQVQLAGAYRWQQTNEVFSEIIQAVSAETTDDRR